MINAKTIARTVFIGLLIVLCSSSVYSDFSQVNLYVSQAGNDAWQGRLDEPNEAKTDGPFATLERARDEIRKMKEEKSFPVRGVKVIVRDGIYYLDKPFELNTGDSGLETAPIVYASYPGENARLVGGSLITGFKTVKDAAVLERLDEKARGRVVSADLKSLGITDYGQADKGGAELFFNDKPMTLSRWPNEGFVKIADLVVEDGHQIHGHKGSKTGKFKYDGERPTRWVNESDPWLHGYWFWDWSDQRQPIESIDAANSIISLKKPYHGYGYRKGQWYYAFNMLSELDSPGEWYIDREQGVLYFWPPEAIDGSTTVMSIIPSLVMMKDVSHVKFQGFTLEASRSTGFTAKGGKGVALSDCIIRNTGIGGASLSGLEHCVTGCDVYRTGSGGISLSGGDRTTLTPGGLYADNNHVHHFGRINRMYTPGIAIHGVGNRASHNLIHTAPHIGIMFSGNDHLFEFNEIHHVCMESNDAGAMYTGRNWTMRGHMIRHNYLHHITGFEGRGCVGIYLDDMFSSAVMYGNVFYKVTRAAFIGGGRDCSIENNIFVDCDPALHIDARALGWCADHADGWIKEANEKNTISGIAYNKPPYSERYPELINILNENPKAPIGNTVARNISWGGKWDGIYKEARQFIKLEDNMIDQDPRFVDAGKQNFNLKPDSPAFKLGFKAIPFNEIGLRMK